MDMDFKLAAAVFRVAQRHIRKGTPIERAWPEVVAAGRRGLGEKVVKAALDIPITDSVVLITAEYANLLGRDQPGKKKGKEVKGLWFGLVEFSMDGTGDAAGREWTPYIAGASRFSAKSQDWPVDPVWMPKDCYAPNAAMKRLSALRVRHPRQSWLIETGLIEPLHALMVGAFVRGTSAAILLGPANSRGIGCGFDDGDNMTLGVVKKSGFEPAGA